MNDKEINNHIKCISIKNWNRLFDLIPKIQSISKFGEWKSGKPDSKGIIEFPYVIEDSIVTDFIDIMEDLNLIINFDWGKWDKGDEIYLRNIFTKQDNVTLIKIL
ncbi:hypothetical protein H8E88_22340, partial [candidate division KSB1 bacterium]|nr:hypothetical protein [candidate division KSB1 bacterium]